MAEAQEQLWMHVQGLLADLVPGAKHLVVEDSGHIIQEDKPQVVIDAIQEVVEGVRSPGSWSR
jgi:pimeloyl-ACP methyl ester carboxylesterase